MAYRVIAIDGPAASGKSSVARTLSRRLAFLYVNSGAIYRAITWQLLRRKVNPSDTLAIAAAAKQIRIQCDLAGKEARVLVERIDPGEHLHDANVNSVVSAISAVPQLREIVVGHLRALAAFGDLVMEGRDIGSVVFPQTPFKFYLDAPTPLRRQRRQAQGWDDQIELRDRSDSGRAIAPLVVAPDAEVIETSALAIEEVVDEIILRLQAKGLHISR